MTRSCSATALLGTVLLAGCNNPNGPPIPPALVLTAPTLAPLDQSTTHALVDGVRAGAVVSIWDRNGALVGITPVNATRLRVPLRRALVVGETLTATQAAAGNTSPASRPVQVDLNYVTYHFDRYRTGWNPYEQQLTVNAVRSRLKLLATLTVDAPVRAQPLFVEKVEITRGRFSDLLIIATENDTVYAFDINANPPTMAWAPRRLVSGTEVAAEFGNVGCDAQLGVSATPVIDRTTNTIYVTGLLQRTAGTGAPLLFRLHALDLTTGLDQAGSPVEITAATVPFTNAAGAPVIFDPKLLGNRPGLLLNRGVLYVAFGSHCFDDGLFFGWVLAYDADVPGTPAFLRRLGVFNTAPDLTPNILRDRAGIWQSGFAPAADEDGNVYVVTGNGVFGGTAFGNSVLKLAPPPFTGGVIRRADSFTPFDWAQFNAGDQDLGAGGAMLVPAFSSRARGNPPPLRRKVIAAGKPGKAYVIDRTAMGGNVLPPGPDRVIQTVDLAPQPATDSVAGGPAYYEGPSGPVVFFGVGRAPLQAYRFNRDTLVLPPVKSAITVPSTSPIPVVSSNGGAAGTGVVWVMIHPGGPNDPMLLQAFDAENFGAAPLLGGGFRAGGWVPVPMHFGGNSFQVPTVIRGRVFTGGDREVRIWGL